MNIAIGICGIGYGHSSRQLVLADAMRSRGHNIVIIAYGTAVDLFRRNKYTVYEVIPPFLRGNGARLIFTNIIRDNAPRFARALITNGRAAKAILREHHPDIFITDYEPISAWMAYCFRKPLVTVDQQSKFRFFPFSAINGFDPREERQRQSVFFPWAAKRFVTSFYKIPLGTDSPSISLIPPLIAPDVYAAPIRDDRLFLVYLSRYFGETIGQDYMALQAIFAKFSSHAFHIYAAKREHSQRSPSNVKFFELDRVSFINDLARSTGVISTGGHTLISEALTLGKPLLVLPLATFDQHYCAHFIESHGLGITSDHVDCSILATFIGATEKFRRNINASDHIMLDRNAVDIIITYLERRQWQPVS